MRGQPGAVARKTSLAVMIAMTVSAGLGVSSCRASAHAASAKALVNPPGSEQIYKEWQYSQAVRVGRTVYVSGQVGVDFKTGAVADGIEAQSRAALNSVREVLRSAGACLEDVVELQSYHVDMLEFPTFRRVKEEFFTKNFPAWTAVGVPALVEPGLRVEVRAVAVIGSGGRGRRENKR